MDRCEKNIGLAVVNLKMDFLGLAYRPQKYGNKGRIFMSTSVPSRVHVVSTLDSPRLVSGTEMITYSLRFALKT